MYEAESDEQKYRADISRACTVHELEVKATGLLTRHFSLPRIGPAPYGHEKYKKGGKGDTRSGTPGTYVKNNA